MISYYKTGNAMAFARVIGNTVDAPKIIKSCAIALNYILTGVKARYDALPAPEKANLADPKAFSSKVHAAALEAFGDSLDVSKHGERTFFFGHFEADGIEQPGEGRGDDFCIYSVELVPNQYEPKVFFDSFSPTGCSLPAMEMPDAIYDWLTEWEDEFVYHYGLDAFFIRDEENNDLLSFAAAGAYLYAMTAEELRDIIHVAAVLYEQRSLYAYRHMFILGHFEED